MKIEHLDPKESKGSILAQSYNLSERKLSKGTLVSKAIVELLNKETSTITYYSKIFSKWTKQSI